MTRSSSREWAAEPCMTRVSRITSSITLDNSEMSFAEVMRTAQRSILSWYSLVDSLMLAR
ncbi:MAG: hypothetical protein MZW92_52670 [Comamonadaceae bacterium]|nr:hypothetical protein [Comamonadaceae bacterium]